MGFFSKSKEDEQVPTLPKVESPRPFINSNDLKNEDVSQGFPSNQNLPQGQQDSSDLNTENSDLNTENSNNLPYPPRGDNLPQQNHSLPSFPNSSFGDDVNQNLIKDAVGNREQGSEMNSEIPQNQEFSDQQQNFNYPQNTPPRYYEPLNTPQGNFQQVGQGRPPTQPIFKTVESPDYEVPEGRGFDTRNFQASATRIQKPSKGVGTQRVETLFIQLDNFEKTIATFNEIKLKISEIESLLKSIRDVKRKEEERLTNWENEIISIKNNLDEIDRNFFNI